MPSSPSLHLQRVSFHHHAGIPLLDTVNLSIPHGRHGLVGANGSGKTTFLQLLSGALSPVSGRVHVSPAGTRVLMVAQDVESVPPAADALESSPGGDARAWRGRLGLEEGMTARWSTLSPGERRRWQLACALWRDPDVLLLDEPTNHVDAHSRALVVEALRRFRGLLVACSHDRQLLDAVTGSTLRITGGRLEAWPGSYSRARHAWEQEEAEQRAEREQLRREVTRAQAILGQARSVRSRAEHQRSAGTRMRNVNDSDARGLGADFRASRAEASHGRHVGAARARHARAVEALEEARVEREHGGDVESRGEPAPMEHLVVLERETVLLPDGTPLLHDVTLALGRRDRVHVRGPNGAGKSTLLAHVMSRVRWDASRAWVLGQEADAEERVRVAEEVQSLPRDERGRVMQWASLLGVDPSRVLASHRLSPGEARKVLLALGLSRPTWLLVLDEPTNHLDLPAIMRLERALSAHAGALLLVTHDDALAAACCTRAWHVEDGTVTDGPVTRTSAPSPVG